MNKLVERIGQLKHNYILFERIIILCLLIVSVAYHLSWLFYTAIAYITCALLLQVLYNRHNRQSSFDRLQTKYKQILPVNNPQPVAVFAANGECVYRNAAFNKRCNKIIHLSDLLPCSMDSLKNQKEHLRINQSIGEKSYAFDVKWLREHECFILFGFDVTTLDKAQKELNRFLTLDQLTGLGNRQKLNQDIAHNNEYIILIALNIVNFGEFNSFYGHRIGDRFLNAYARLLEKHLRQINPLSQAYRLNGNTFAMLITFAQANPQYIKSLDLILKEVHHALAQYKFNIDNIQTSFTPRFGISVDKQHKDVELNYAENLISNAETALQEAKNRDVSILYYEDIPDIKRKYSSNLKWSKKLRNMLIYKEHETSLVSYFQPIYNLKTSRIEKYEALVRIQDGDTLYPPIEFLKAAEQLHLLSKITRIVVVDLLKQLSNNDLSGSVNISHQDLCDQQLIEFFQEQCHAYNVPPARITLEMLEDELMYENMLTIQEWKKAGYKIAIDDFGVGYSNFKKLQLIEADYIKIDGSLIKNIIYQEQDIKIVNSIASYAKAINAEVIAEFVSDEAIFKQLQKMDIDYAQGFFIGKPNPSLEVVTD